MPGWDNDNWDHPWGFGWIGAVVMISSMIVLWGGLAVLAILVARRLWHRDADGDGAQRILDERFARGEIGKDEYVDRRQALHAGGRSAR